MDPMMKTTWFAAAFATTAVLTSGCSSHNQDQSASTSGAAAGGQTAAPAVVHADGDARVVSCRPPNPSHQDPYVRAVLEVTNHGNETRHYRISLAYLDASGTRLELGYPGADKVRPGETADVDATGPETTSATVRCEIVETLAAPASMGDTGFDVDWG